MVVMVGLILAVVAAVFLANLLAVMAVLVL
jgi:hypothetical protein